MPALHAMPSTLFRLPPVADAMLERLVTLGLLDAVARHEYVEARLDRLRELSSEEKLLFSLCQAGLLTGYQVDRLLCGSTHGLVLGNYRVLAEIGKGGMGVVHLAEHRLMRRRVAVKVLKLEDDCPDSVKARFFSEMRLLAELSHPNIVTAFDAGEVPAQGREPALLYLVTELIEGGDLEKQVVKKGVLSIEDGCACIRQAAAGLQAAHDRHLVHRDLKPSNLLLNATGEVKLVDFGLARHFASRLTDPRSLLGSIEFMSPEQSHDPSNVGKAADIYGLGATLFWLLTGEGPYPHQAHVGQALRQIQQHPPRRLRFLRPDAPSALDNLLARMLERDPARRPASAVAVANALRQVTMPSPSHPGTQAQPSRPRVLVVAEQAQARSLQLALAECGNYEVAEANDGQSALELAHRAPFDLVLLSETLPNMNDDEACARFREQQGNPNLKILIVAAVGTSAASADRLPRGADGFVRLPGEREQLILTVRHALALKAAQDRSTAMGEQLALLNGELERSLRSREGDIRRAHDALLFTMAKMAEQRDGETPGHLKRMQAYTRALAREAAKQSSWHGRVDASFLAQLERCVPLHDIGKLGLPDDILLKPASLSPSERMLVQEHPLIGDRILEALGKEHGTALDFLNMSRMIVRHHHERWDGKGYPDGLAGDAIPQAARLVAVADVYDALRRMRLYKPAMSHAAAIRLMTERSEGQFDPSLMRALLRCQGEFECIYADNED